MAEAPHDPEGEALEAEIAADKRDVRERKKRRVLFVPPLVALAVAAWALGVSRPREVIAARAWAGARPPAGQPLRFRAMVVRALPGVEGVSAAPHVELRPFAGGTVRGVAETTNDDGVAEVTVDAPLPPSIELQAKTANGYRTIATVPIASLPAPDPKNGLLAMRRTGGVATGDLKIDVGPELGALAPPLAGAVWVRVRGKGGVAVGATVTLTAEAGLSSDPSPVTTDAAGLARIAVTPTAPPVIVGIKATLATESGNWHGVVGAVLATPVPSGDGRIAAGSNAIDILPVSSRGSAYVDLWQAGVRLGGARVSFANGRGTFPLPAGLSGVVELETSTSPMPSSPDDLAHAGAFPLVIATDPVDAWGALASSPRIEEKVTPAPGQLSSYPSAVAATLAFAAPALPKRPLIADGLDAELQREVRRGQTVRRAATFAVIGGGLVEFGLMLWLGVFAPPPSVADVARELGDDEPVPHVPQPKGRKLLAVLLTSIGIVALIFASLAIMAWGLP